MFYQPCAWLPFEDGITHINLYSQSPVLLGRQMSHFAAIGFHHPEWGTFASMEGFWYWLKSGGTHDELRTLTGHFAKNVGKTLSAVHRPDFMRVIEKANELKLEQNPALKEAFTRSTLPLTHYYVKNKKALGTGTTIWFEYFFSKLRARYQGKIEDRMGKRVIVAGSRTIDDPLITYKAIEASPFHYEFGILVSGVANGPDTHALRWARDRFLNVKEFPADWQQYGKRAGFVRNQQMADYADALVAVIKDHSNGTADMIERMRAAKKPTYVVTI